MNAAPAARRHHTLGRRILIALIAGALTGVFLGDRARIFEVAADGFVKLLQMAVLPYVTVSVTASIGGLAAEHLRAVGVRLLLTLTAVWALALLFAFLMPLTFPPAQSGAFFSTTLLEPPAELNLLDLYIPANPFFALANNIVPAVVLFSIVVGIALVGLPRKRLLLDVLETTAAALSRAMRFITSLTPYGIFAIAAATAGTLRIEEAGRLQIYLVAYAALALLVSLWVLPGLISALTPISVREIFVSTREALLTAAIAGDLFIVLPLLIAAAKELVARHLPERADAPLLPDLIVPIAYNFPHSGKLLSLSFVLFAGWFSDAAVDPTEYPRLALAGLMTLFGSVNVAVPFLLDLFRIPADTFHLFLATSVINSRVGSLAAAMHTVAVALLGTCALTGLLRWRVRPVVHYAAITAALTVAVIGGTRLAAEGLLGGPRSNAEVLDAMTLPHAVDAVVKRSEPPEPVVATPGARLDTILRTRTLRVGYLSDALPFAFFNARDELVGFDIAMMHELARELGARLEFVPAARAALEESSGPAAQLGEGHYDVLVGGLAVTTTRASLMQISATYLSETLGLVVRDDQRRRFESWDALRHASLTIAVPDVPYFVEKIQQRLPGARLEPIDNIGAAFASAATGDAMLLPAERGSAWTLRYPRYAVVVPAPGQIKVPLCYALPRGESALAAFVNTWIDLKRQDGTIDQLYQYWILGRTASAPQPRWSIVRDVLHWVD